MRITVLPKPPAFLSAGGPAVLALLAVGLGSCRKEPVESLGAPAILQFYERAGTIGAVVHVIGTNFSKTAQHNAVLFGGQEAPAFAVRGDTLQVRVPAGATTGPLTVRVYQQQAVGSQAFTVLTGHWRRKTDFGGRARASATSFAVNGEGYVGTQGGLTDWWAYDPGSNRWSRQADVPGGSRGGALSFAIGSLGYMGFGMGTSLATLNDFYAFDPATNRWSRKAGLQAVDADHAVAFALNGRGYVVYTDYLGGQATWEYNPQTDSWLKKADFPGAERYVAAGMAIGAKGYVGGGTTGGRPLLQDFWEYTPRTNVWTRKADLPQPGESPLGFAISDKGYWGFGSSLSKTFFEYNPAQDTWVPKAYFPGQALWDATAFSLGSKGYVATGDGAYQATAELWEFTP